MGSTCPVSLSDTLFRGPQSIALKHHELRNVVLNNVICLNAANLNRIPNPNNIAAGAAAAVAAYHVSAAAAADAGAAAVAAADAAAAGFAAAAAAVAAAAVAVGAAVAAVVAIAAIPEVIHAIHLSLARSLDPSI